MDLTFLRELYEKGFFSIHEKFDDWHDAIRASIAPMVKAGALEESYAQSIFDGVKEYGPYICIAPDVCLPHAMNSGNVNENAICFMKCNTPVVFDEEENHQSRLFFALAANKTEEHFQHMKELMEMLDQDNLIDLLLEAETEEDFKKLLYE